jgi:general secretion pathway protein H
MPSLRPPHRPSARRGLRGFTLLELLVVVSLVALTAAGVSLALRDTSANQLEREAQRLGALLDSARANARTSGVAILWRPDATGFWLDDVHRDWLVPGSSARLQTPEGTTAPTLALGPEPLMPPVHLALSLDQRTIWLSTDGLRPFSVTSEDAPATAAAGTR